MAESNIIFLENYVEGMGHVWRMVLTANTMHISIPCRQAHLGCHQTFNALSTPSRHWMKRQQVCEEVFEEDAHCVWPARHLPCSHTGLQHTIQQLAEQCIARHPQYLPSSRSSPASAAGGDQEDVCGVWWSSIVVCVRFLWCRNTCMVYL